MAASTNTGEILSEELTRDLGTWLAQLRGMGLLALVFFCLVICVVVVVVSKKSTVSGKPSDDGLWTPRGTQQVGASSSLPHIPPAPSRLAPTAPDEAKPRSLEDLSWQEFELLVGELFRRQGFAVQMCSGDGSDGGVDLRLEKDGRKTLVQCKHWKVYRVGPAPVRELFGILTGEGADRAVLLTTGKITRDAMDFAVGKPMDLIDGEKLGALISQASNHEDGHLLDVASWSHRFARTASIIEPLCPFCRGQMVLRQGRKSGNKFWGCKTYPRCRGKRNVRAELLPIAASA